MIEKRVRKLLDSGNRKRLLIYDIKNFVSCFDYTSLLKAEGFKVYFYDDVEHFRYLYETQMRDTDIPCAVIINSDIYVPTDIRKSFYEVKLSLKTLYPNMDVSVLSQRLYDLELIDTSYDLFDRCCLQDVSTKDYINNEALSAKSIQEFIIEKEKDIRKLIDKSPSYTDWIYIAKTNAKLERYSCLHNIKRDQQFIDEAFKNFIFDGYQKLSGIVSTESPTILPKVIDKIATREKVALVIVDGMSMFDFEVLTPFLNDFDYKFGGSFALIPTITSVSRQALLAGKYPLELEQPFSLVQEESGFISAAKEKGYDRAHCFYGRGYDSEPGHYVRFAAIIINDIDDLVHGQHQGRMGMYNDVNLWAKEGKIQRLFHKLLNRGFKVYLTSDHGNTHCIGGGSIRKFGVETETRTKRMVVLKDFADVSEELKERTFEYPGYYLNKEYQYRICNGRTSFDNKNEDVMTHGGITLEEVVVPFVEIRRKNG